MLHFPGQIPKQYHLEKKMEQLLWWSLSRLQATSFAAAAEKNQSACQSTYNQVSAAMTLDVGL